MRYPRNKKYADLIGWAWRQKEIMIDTLWRDEFTCQPLAATGKCVSSGSFLTQDNRACLPFNT